VNLDQDFFAISIGHAAGIPALELELTTNNHYLLIFSSELAAHQYCYHRKPDKKDDVYQLERKLIGNDVVQVGLQRLARRCKNEYKHIVGVMWDHPGLTGKPVEVTSIRDVIASISSSRTIPEPTPKKFGDDLLAYFEGDESKSG